MRLLFRGSLAKDPVHPKERLGSLGLGRCEVLDL